tara:strand:+ start:337 stop:501 length:165 start_codon:yes stop_codon:yes gene_type:complete
MRKSFKYRKFKDNLEKRVVELRSKIITDACFEGKVDKVTTTLFLKYNEMLKKYR